MKKLKYLIPINEFFENFFNDDELNDLAKKVIKGFSDKYNKLNFIKRYSNSGANGNAFEFSNNNVLKITKDVSEAINAYHLSKMSNLKHFAKYYEVIRMVLPEDIFKNYAFGIMMEKINPLKDEKVVSELLGFYRCKHHKEDVNSEEGGLAPKFYNYNIESYEDFLKNNSEDRLIKTFGNNATYKKYYLLLNEMMKEAKEHKIIIGDIDTGNLGFNSAGNLIIFDLGGMGNAFNEDGSRMSKDERISFIKNFKVITPELNNVTVENLKNIFNKK